MVPVINIPTLNKCIHRFRSQTIMKLRRDLNFVLWFVCLFVSGDIRNMIGRQFHKQMRCVENIRIDIIRCLTSTERANQY